MFYLISSWQTRLRVSDSMAYETRLSICTWFSGKIILLNPSLYHCGRRIKKCLLLQVFRASFSLAKLEFQGRDETGKLKLESSKRPHVMEGLAYCQVSSLNQLHFLIQILLITINSSSICYFLLKKHDTLVHIKEDSSVLSMSLCQDNACCIMKT